MSHSIFYSGHSRRVTITNSFIDWFVARHIGKRYKLDFHVITRGLKRDNMYGEVGILDSVSRPRFFEITIHSGLSKWDYLVTLAHEMVHVKQRVLGEWKQTKNKNYWHKDIVPSTTQYDDEPWEIDARKWEKYIAERALYEGIVTL
tara:strand:- start:98 stop:535 length:438 start_codon:yes stop_codon:yes gene_type:complete